MFRRKISSALFIDFNNIAAQFVGGGFGDAVQGWLPWLEDGRFDPRGRRRRFTEKRVFLNKPYERYATLFEQAGFVVVPSAADSIIGYDIADLVHLNKNITEYVVLTVDRGFDHVLERLGERRKQRVVTIKAGEGSAKSFPLRSEITISIEDLRKAFEYERQKTFFGRLSGAVSWVRAQALHAAELTLEGLKRLRPHTHRAPIGAPLRKAAAHVAELALGRPGVPAGFDTIMRYLKRKMPDLHAAGRYAGCGSFNRMIREIAAIYPELKLVRARRGLAIIAPPNADD